MSLFLYRLGRAAVRHRWRVLAVWLVVLFGLGFGAKALGGKTVDDFSMPGTETQRAMDLLKAQFPSQAGTTAQVALRARSGTVADPATTAALADTTARIRALPHVSEVTPVVTPAMLGLRPAPDFGLVLVHYDELPKAVGISGYDALRKAVAPLGSDRLEVSVGGDLAQQVANHKPENSEQIGIAAAVLTLLVAFGSVVAMGLPLGTALVGLGTGLSLIGVGERFITVGSVTPTIATMIGLGVGIDYALFIVTRHREHLQQGMTVEESIARSMATAGQAVLFAGTTVVIAICGLAFVGIPMVTTMGFGCGLLVAVAVLAAETLLPALLGFAGHRVNSLDPITWFRRKVLRRPVAAGHVSHGVAHRWSTRVSSHPWRYLVASVVLLGVLTIPFSSIRIGQADAGNDPKGTPTRATYDLLARGFGPGFNGPLMLVVGFSRPQTPAQAHEAQARVAAAARADRGVAAVMPGAVSPTGRAALVQVFPTTSPQDEATQSLVHRLRDHVVPGVQRDAGLQHVYVSGTTAALVDISDKITAGLPVFIGAVLVMSFLLLLVVFRSIFVPVKAALMNLLGISAAYGIVVAIFQWGWGGSLFGLTESLPVVSFLPMFMFAILFGLSMDYEVFLMSRIREEYLRHGDNLRSVGRGIDTTARVITAAAVIMVSVFGSFALGQNHIVQMMGIGLSSAILLDATVIRMVLVPSTMALLGDWNWWLPGWLDRRLPHVDLEGEAGLPAPQYEPGRGPAGGDAGTLTPELAEAPA